MRPGFDPVKIDLPPTRKHRLVSVGHLVFRENRVTCAHDDAAAQLDVFLGPADIGHAESEAGNPPPQLLNGAR